MSSFLKVVYHLYLTSFKQSLPKGCYLNLILIDFETKEDNLYFTIGDFYGYVKKHTELLGASRYLVNESVLKLLSEKDVVSAQDYDLEIIKEEELKSKGLKKHLSNYIPLYLDSEDKIPCGLLNFEIFGPIDSQINFSPVSSELQENLYPFMSSILQKDLFPLSEKIFKIEDISSIASQCRISFTLMESYFCEVTTSRETLQRYLAKK